MKKELKDDLINKLLNQQTIVQNSSNEVDFRRAEVTAQLVFAIAELENLPVDFPIKVPCIPVDEFKKKCEEAGVLVQDKMFVSNGEKSAVVDVDKPIAKKTVQKRVDKFEEIMRILTEKDKPMRVKELSDELGYGESTKLNQYVNMYKKKLTIVYFAGNHKSDYMFLCLPEWLDSDGTLKIPYLNKLVAVQPKSSFIKTRVVEQKKQEKELKPILKGEKINKGTGHTFKIETQTKSLCKNVEIGDDVKFFDVLRNQVIGKIISLNPPYKRTPKGDLFEHKTVTIKHEGNLYDRALNQILKYE
jgi:hypothetical protein